MFAARNALLRNIRRPGAVVRCMSTEAAPPTPPLLLKLRSDLKDAMRSKNQAKLDALRNLLATINNALKSPQPPTQDSHILTLIQKALSQSSSSIADFRTARRDDLVAKEQAQADVLAAYAESVEVVTREEVVRVVEEVMRGMGERGEKVGMGGVMREVSRVLEEGGKGWVKGEVAAVVKQIVGTGK